MKINDLRITADVKFKDLREVEFVYRGAVFLNIDFLGSDSQLFMTNDDLSQKRANAIRLEGQLVHFEPDTLVSACNMEVTLR